MFYEGINIKVFRRSIAFAITVVVTSRSSSFEYTISGHAVHASAERNVCNIVINQTQNGISSVFCPGCDEGTNLHLCDFAVVLLMPTREIAQEIN